MARAPSGPAGIGRPETGMILKSSILKLFVGVLFASLMPHLVIDMDYADRGLSFHAEGWAAVESFDLTNLEYKSVANLF